MENDEIDPKDLRYSMWVELTGRGEELRGAYPDKSLAIENANKYWLTPTGLFRVLIRDRAEGDAIIFDRSYAAPRKRLSPDKSL